MFRTRDSIIIYRAAFPNPRVRTRWNAFRLQMVGSHEIKPDQSSVNAQKDTEINKTCNFLSRPWVLLVFIAACLSQREKDAVDLVQNHIETKHAQITFFRCQNFVLSEIVLRSE